MKVLSFLRNLFGFKRNSKYVRKFLNDANIRSSIYMSFIIIAIEIYMIFRQTRKYIRPSWNSYSPTYTSRLQLVFQYTSLYWLFIMCSLAMFMFALFYITKKRGKKSFITNIVFGSLCIIWTFLLIPELNLPGYASGTIINKVTTIAVYVSMFLFGSAIIGNSIYRRFKDKDNTFLSVFVIACFAAVCLLFGIKVGYSDFANPWVKNGEFNTQKIKMITCFLTMIIFVACLLIWKPYISILMLTGIFVGFDYILCQYGVDRREFLEADRINYYTFLIALVAITLSIYQQRITEAVKDEQLIYDANYDSLVDLHNGRYFAEKITNLEKENPNFITDKIYLFINISNFKIINTQKGFDYGDKFLKRFAKDVDASFPRDYTARLADDHFIVLTKQEGFMDKIDVLKKLMQVESDGLFVVLSVGGYKAQVNESPQRAIDKARYACSMNKKTGTMYKEYDNELDLIFTKRQYVVNYIFEAIEKGYITAYYQPIVWSNDQNLCGAEALARWIDPTYGMLSPREFIPVLEKARLIHHLDRFMLEYVCREMRRAIDENRPVVPVSLNFSRLDFDLMNVKEELDKTLAKYNIDKDYIHVEITESALSQNQEELKVLFDELKESGYDIWVDDFGSGYSSLNALKDFVFDVIKIDMKFLSNFNKNEKTKEILDCIIQLATRLGMKTLTEGVETVEEAEFLDRIGCGRLQGYLFGKPYKLKDFEEEIYNGNLKISEHLI